MTLKNSFFKLLKQEWKQKIWCPILIFVSFFLVLEIQMILVLQDMEKWPASYHYSKAYYIANMFAVPDTNMLFTVATCFAGILAAMCIFSYVHTKQKLDLFHSLPVKRETYFWTKLASGITFYAIPTILHLLICMGICMRKSALSVHGVKGIFGFFCVELLIFLLFYVATVFCMMLTGNMILSVLATCVIMPYSLILSLMKAVLYQRFYYSSVQDYDWNPVYGFSPIHMIYNMYTDMQNYREMNAGFSYQSAGDTVLVFLLGILCFGVFSYVLYKKRATEAAGKAIAFGFTEPFIKFMIVFPVSMLSGELATDIAGTRVSGAWYLFGVVFGFLFSGFVVEIIFRLDMKGIFKHWKQMVFNGACIALTIIVMKNDVLGFNTYVPSQKETESVSCYVESLTGTYSYGSRSQDDCEYALETVKFDTDHSAYAFAEKMAKEGLHHEEYEQYEGIEETSVYKELVNREKNYRQIYYCYHLKNGKNVYRRYYFDITDAESMKYLADIYNTVDYKIGTTPILQSGWNKKSDTVECIGKYGNNQIIAPTEEQYNKILDAYQSDLMNMTLEQLMTEAPIGRMDFCWRKDYWKCYAGNKIYPEFSKTIAALKECGYDVLEDCTDQIKEVTIYDYSYDTDGKLEEEFVCVTYTDQEQIKEILENAVSDEMNFTSYMPLDHTYDIEASINGESRYMLFEKDKIPYYVENDIKAIVKENGLEK